PLSVIVKAVAVEIVVGTLALVAPRVAWPFVLVVLGVFSTVLVRHMVAGGGNCGCFGGAPIPAGAVLGGDLALALGVVVSATVGRLWRFDRSAFVSGARALPWSIVLALGFAWFAEVRLRAFETPVMVEPTWQLPATIPPQVLLRPSEWLNKKLAIT